MFERRPYIARLFRENPEAGRAAILVALERRGGNVRTAAHDLCLSRRHLYRLISRAMLWGRVDELRLARREKNKELPWKK